MFGRSPKMLMLFTISLGEQVIPIYKYYNLDSIIGPPGFDGVFSIGRRSNFYRDYARLFGEFDPDFDPMKVFEDKKFLCRVGTVNKDPEGELLANETLYSKITRVKKVIK